MMKVIFKDNRSVKQLRKCAKKLETMIIEFIVELCYYLTPV